jgi:hypothetical protein
MRVKNGSIMMSLALSCFPLICYTTRAAQNGEQGPRLVVSVHKNYVPKLDLLVTVDCSHHICFFIIAYYIEPQTEEGLLVTAVSFIMDGLSC